MNINEVGSFYGSHCMNHIVQMVCLQDTERYCECATWPEGVKFNASQILLLSKCLLICSITIGRSASISFIQILVGFFTTFCSI
jgi:hypothetical protein